jgi:uncharacterized membrane protein
MLHAADRSRSQENPVSELTVIGFRGPLRAAQVMTEIRLLNPDDTLDLDHALVVTHTESGRLRVHQTLDPRSEGETAWAGLWGSLISATLQVSAVEALQEAAGAVTSGPLPAGQRCSCRMHRSADPLWWLREVGLPCEFIGDVGVLLRPGSSAIFLLSWNTRLQTVLRQLSRCGGILLRFPLSRMQEARLQAALGDT